MIFQCQNHDCHYLFVGNEQTDRCPDCGKKQIRPANKKARAEYLLLKTEFSSQERETRTG